MILTTISSFLDISMITRSSSEKKKVAKHLQSISRTHIVHEKHGGWEYNFTFPYIKITSNQMHLHFPQDKQ